MLEAEFDSAAGQCVHCLAPLHEKLAQFIARHPLLRVLKSRTELEKCAEVVDCLPREDVDQPGAPGRSSELAYLGGQLSVPSLLRRGDQLLPSFNEVIGREGVQLIGGGIDVHEDNASSVRPTAVARS
jgi:hypothetical protein